MATKKKPLTQAEKELVAQARILKAKGLAYVGKDLRGFRPTRHTKRLVEKFEGVLRGRDQVVTVPRGKAKAIGEHLPRSGNKVAVPITEKGGRAYYSKKTGQIVTTKKYPGGKLTAIKGPFSLEELRAWEGPGHAFQVPVNRWRHYDVYRKDTIDELQELFGQGGSFRNFGEWLTHVDKLEWKPDRKSDGLPEDLEEIGVDTTMPERVERRGAPKKRKPKSKTKAKGKRR